MAKLKKIQIERTPEEIQIEIRPIETQTTSNNSRKEELLKLYDTLKKEGIRSISDLENLIARAE